MFHPSDKSLNNDEGIMLAYEHIAWSPSDALEEES
jgi:hypothetical protein